MRLLGENWPNTLAGTKLGNPTAAAALSPVFKNPRSETLFFRISLMAVSPEKPTV
jgi:hypothetical protein